MTLISFEEKVSLPAKLKILQKLRDFFPKTQVVVALQGDEKPEDYDLLKNAGAHYLILSEEIKNSGKLYYLSAVLVQGAYFPVPVTDVFPSTQLSFNAYHKLLLNQKFLPVIFSGFPISDKKYRKLEPSKQIYVRRESLDEYRKYVEAYHDRTGSALKKRCRVVMMNLVGIQCELLLQLTLDVEVRTEISVKEKISRFVQSSLELGDYLQDCPDVWNVIAHSLDFKFCHYERSIYILAYALYISAKAKLTVLSDLVMTVLLADLGILELPVECYKTLQSRGEKQLSPQDLEYFHNHPIASLNRLKFHQVELSEEVQSALVCTHERNDLKGFPNQVPGDKIPVAAKLIFFCELLDRRLRATQEDGITHDFIRKQVWEEERDSLARFSADFLDKIEKVLIA
jgi:hypothetical protein